MRNFKSTAFIGLLIVVLTLVISTCTSAARLPFRAVWIECDGSYTVLGINIYGRIDGGPQITVATASDPLLQERACCPGDPVIWALQNLTTGISGTITITGAELTYACHLPPVVPGTWRVVEDWGPPPWFFPCSPSGITVRSYGGPPTPAPTFNRWGLITLGVFLGGSLAWMVRRRVTTRPSGA